MAVGEDDTIATPSSAPGGLAAIRDEVARRAARVLAAFHATAG